MSYPKYDPSLVRIDEMVANKIKKGFISYFTEQPRKTIGVHGAFNTRFQKGDRVYFEVSVSGSEEDNAKANEFFKNHIFTITDVSFIVSEIVHTNDKGHMCDKSTNIDIIYSFDIRSEL